MDAGQRKTAEAAEARRGELGLSQLGTGVDPKTWREFINGRIWPTARSRGRIEGNLGLKFGALQRIASGESDFEHEIDPRAEVNTGPGVAPAELDQISTIAAELKLHYQQGESNMVVLKRELLRNLVDQLATTSDQDSNGDADRAVG